MPEKAIRDHSHLTREEIALVRQMYRAGKTQVDIAQFLGCSQPTVSKWLEVVNDPLDDAKHILREGSPDLAKRILKDADVEESLEVLDRLGVAEKRNTDSNRAGTVQVIIGMPGSSAGPAPLIDLSPVPRSELAP